MPLQESQHGYAGFKADDLFDLKSRSPYKISNFLLGAHADMAGRLFDQNISVLEPFDPVGPAGCKQNEKALPSEQAIHLAQDTGKLVVGEMLQNVHRDNFLKGLLGTLVEMLDIGRDVLDVFCVFPDLALRIAASEKSTPTMRRTRCARYLV